MSVSFRPAVRENVGLLIGLAGGTGSGKTYSALRLAAGICGDKPFAFIDTESRRGLHYADDFKFDHAELRPPFRPDAYADAIQTADKAGYGAIVIDSMSHEWAGDGGVLDWQEEEYKRLGGRDAIKLLSWSAPKQGHKKMVSRLLQSRAHLIFCFRAEPHVEMVKVTENGQQKTKIVPKTGPTGLNGWFPITEKNLPFEMTASFLLTADAPGIPKPIKLQRQHHALFPLDQEITEESGRRIAEWARGGVINGAASFPTSRSAGAQSDVETDSGPIYINFDQATLITDRLHENAINVAKFCEAAKVQSVQFILAADYQRALGAIDATLENRRKKATA